MTPWANIPTCPPPPRSGTDYTAAPGPQKGPNACFLPPPIGGTRGRCATASGGGGDRRRTGTRWATINACRGFGACATMNLIFNGEKKARLRDRPEITRSTAKPTSFLRARARFRPGDTTDTARAAVWTDGLPPRPRETGRKPIGARARVIRFCGFFRYRTNNNTF